ncbi:MAG TPA: histidinol dehydrogenase, partial [Polyangiaceae bacterium LLY-WYZ-15_(1-7)]|nr:histidinol dehydrogenase [Polyangiaceae bacterium LLY-WYZ-15_(1-7)]
MLTFHVQGEAGYEDALAQLARRGDADLERVEESVRAILAAVRDRGDEAIRELTEKFEQRRQEHVRLPEALWRAQAKEAPAEVREALAAAAER